MNSKVNFSRLIPYIPEKSIVYVEKWLMPYWFHLTVKKPRNTKLGDYRFPMKGSPHKITINSDMSKPLCFFTLTHEIAHLIAFDVHSTKILPHGKEWKKVFSDLLLESIEVYEGVLKGIVLNHVKNPKAGFFADQELSAYFIKEQNPNVLLLKNLEINKEFELKNKIFYKLDRIKTRYLCIEKKTKKKYLIAGNAAIKEIN